MPNEVNSFLSCNNVMGRDLTDKIKTSQKLALLPFPSKFGVQDVDRFSQSPGNFGLSHLNVSYMTNFLDSHFDCSMWHPHQRDCE